MWQGGTGSDAQSLLYKHNTPATKERALKESLLNCSKLMETKKKTRANTTERQT